MFLSRKLFRLENRIPSRMKKKRWQEASMEREREKGRRRGLLEVERVESRRVGNHDTYRYYFSPSIYQYTGQVSSRFYIAGHRTSLA